MPTTNRADALRFRLQMAEIAGKIGGRIRELREEKGLSQRELADLLEGMKNGNDVSRWERGKHKPHDDTLTEIAEALGTTLGDLYGGPVDEREKPTATPDLMDSLNGPSVEERLERMERSQAKIEALLVDLNDAVVATQKLIGLRAAALADEATRTPTAQQPGETKPSPRRGRPPATS